MQAAEKTRYNLIWEPISGSSQELAISSPCSHTLYHGTRGPGKTIVQLMFFRQRVGIGYGKYWRGVIFDVEHKNLDDLVAQSELFFPQFDDGCKFLKSASGYKWVWKTGEELLFRHIKITKEYSKYHGHQYPFIGWNELTKYATPDLYDSMCSTNRSGFVPEIHTPRLASGDYDTDDKKPLPPIPLQIFSTTNPSGPGHNWVKRRFITPAQNGEIVRNRIEVFDPRLKKDVDVEISQVSIFGSYRENIYLDAKYIAELNRATASNENLRKAWLEGSWEITAGGALDDIWDSNVHVVDEFDIPSGWIVDRAFDWGSSHPFSVGWWAEANGEEIELKSGRTFCPKAGSLIQIDEWYGCEEIGGNKGLKMSAVDVAVGIKEKDGYLLGTKRILTDVVPGPADNSISDVRESDVDTIEKKMNDHGVIWTKSDKSPGSRKNGLQLMRDRLEASARGEGPGLYFMRNCTASIETLPVLPRDEKKIDDVDTTAEDHCYDMVRYRVLQGNNRVVSGGSYY